MKVPFVDFKKRFANAENDLVEIFRRIGHSGAYISGPEVQEFEEKAANLCKVNYAIGVANGTDGLFLIMRAMGIGPGDEVITTPNSFIASAGSIAATGATPRFVDIQDDLNMDSTKLTAAINENTKAIMPVHLTGRPADMDAINSIAKQHGLFVIEDAAQAIGATYKDRPVGSLGDAASFSLHPLKNIHAYGDAGFVTTNDSALNDKIRSLKNHGLADRDTCMHWGYNSRLDNLQAAFAIYQLNNAKAWTEGFRKQAKAYHEGLKGIVTVPEDKEHEYCVYHNFVIYVEQRDELMAFLAERGVDTKIHYPVLLHLQPAAKDLGYKKGSFPKAEYICEHMMSLPIYPELSDKQIAYVISCISEFFKQD